MASTSEDKCETDSSRAPSPTTNAAALSPGSKFAQVELKSLLALVNADVPSDAATARHLSEFSAPFDAEGRPVWAGIARDLLQACSFRTLATVEQRYGRRVEELAVVHVSILKDGYTGPPWMPSNTPNPLQLLVSLTHARVVGEDETSEESESAAHIHMLESSELRPVAIAHCTEMGSTDAHPPWHSRNSFIVKTGNKQLADGLAWRTGVICSSSTAKRATHQHGYWHVALLAAAAREHLKRGDDGVPSSSFLESISQQSFSDTVRKSMRFAQDGGVKGIKQLVPGYQIALWHAAQDGDGAAEEAAGAKRKKRKADESKVSEGTAMLLEALRSAGVKLEADARPNSKARKQSLEVASRVVATAAAVGAQEGFELFGGAVLLPSEVFHEILLAFTVKGQSGHSGRLSHGGLGQERRSGQKMLTCVVPRVCKAWLAAAQDPSLHHEIDRPYSPLTMTEMLQVLKAPRFAQLRRLTLTSSMKLGKTGGAKLAKAAPLLEHLDFGYGGRNFNPKDEELVELPHTFPNLNSVAINFWNMTSWGVCRFATAMGERLHHLKVMNDTITTHYLCDHALTRMAKCCPELRSLHVEQSYIRSYGAYGGVDRLTDTGVRDLLQGCRSIESLDFHHSQNLSLELFEHMADRISEAAAARATDDGARGEDRLPCAELRTLRLSYIPALSADSGEAVKLRLRTLLGGGFQYEDEVTYKARNEAARAERERCAEAEKGKDDKEEMDVDRSPQ